MLKIGCCSDLHTEFGDYFKHSPEDGGDVLILAGDITTAWALASHRTDAEGRSQRKNFSKLNKELLSNFNKVYMVLGNHEHYHSIFRKTKASLQKSFNDLNINIHILDNDKDVIDDVLFVGTTLWADFEKGNPVSMANCEFGLNDFRIIGMLDVEDLNYFNRHKSRAINAEFILQEHINSVKYLELIFSQNKNEKTVVITHHGPTYKSLHREHVGNGLDGIYASDLSQTILDNPQIKYWVSGHTHFPQKYTVGETVCLSNPRGYRGERSHKEYSGIKYFEV